MKFLNLTDTSRPLEEVKQELARYCSTPWNQVGRGGVGPSGSARTSTCSH